MTDIVDTIQKITHNAWDESATTTIPSHLLKEATDEIERLRSALRRIGYDYVELSYEKVQWLYLEHIKIAKEAYQKSFSELLDTKPSDSPIDDNF